MLVNVNKDVEMRINFHVSFLFVDDTS